MNCGRLRNCSSRSFDLDALQRFFRRRIFELQPLQRAQQQLGDHHVAMCLRIGGNRCTTARIQSMSRRARPHTRSDIRPTACALRDRTTSNFQCLVGSSMRACRRSRCSSFEMCRKHLTIVVPLSASSASNSRICDSGARILLVDLLQHARHEHVFVVAAVEHVNSPAAGACAWTRQRKSCAASTLGGRLERHDAQAERIDFVKHRADRAVLAARVHALQHEQHACARCACSSPADCRAAAPISRQPRPISSFEPLENGFDGRSTDARSNVAAFLPPSKYGTRKSSSSGFFAMRALRLISLIWSIKETGCCHN